MQQDLGSGDVAVGLHEQGADVLVDAGQMQVIFFQNGEQVVQQFRRDAELGLLAGGDDLGVMAGADTGVEAHHDLAAGIDAAQGLHLGKGIHADQYAVPDGIAQLVFRDVVGDVEDLVGGEPRQLVHV